MAELRRDEGSFPSRDNLKLFWISTLPASPKAHIGLVHGYAEHIGRYGHVMDHLAEQGYAVHGFDCRGHGRSEGRRGHCGSFQEYLDDLALFLERVKVAAGDQKIFLMGHSHGALISARYLLNHPPNVAGAVMTSPFFRLALKPPPLKIFAATLVGKIYPGLHVANEIKSEQLTRDAEMVAKHKADKLVISVATPGWLGAATQAQEQVLSGAKGMSLPFGVFAGESDPIADHRAGKEFYEAASSTDKLYKGYPGSLHEVLNETNRAEVLADITAWFDKRV